MTGGEFFFAIASRTFCKGLGKIQNPKSKIQNRKGAVPRSLKITANNGREALGEHPFLLEFLAIDAERRPGDGLQALLADRGAAVGADTVLFGLHAIERLFDQ